MGSRVRNEKSRATHEDLSCICIPVAAGFVPAASRQHLMKQVLVRSGEIVVEEVPAPSVGPKEILVRVGYSCVSAGTELAGLRTSALPLYRRALKQPEHVRQALEMARDQGIMRTWQRVSGKLAAGTPTGYSVAGEVVATGSEVDGFHAGDRVACAGAGIANHAELVS